MLSYELILQGKKIASLYQFDFTNDADWTLNLPVKIMSTNVKIIIFRNKLSQMSDTTVKDTESEYQIDSTQPVIFTSKGKISLSIINEALHYIKSRQIELDDFVVFTKSEFKTLQNKLTKISEPSSIRH